MKKFFIFSLLCLLMSFGFVPNAQAQTPCGITSLPYTEGFETGVDGIPNCYTRNPLGTWSNGTLYPQVRTANPHSGSSALEAFNNYYDDTDPNVPTIVFPELASQFNMSSIVMEFWGADIWGTEAYFVVGVMDSDTGFSTFTNVATIHPTIQDNFVKYTIYFNQYTGTGRYIAIKFANGTGYYGRLVIDDVVLTEAAECGPVQYLSLENVYGTDATIQWQPNAVGNPNWYNVSLVNLDDGTVLANTTTYDTFYTFSALSFSSHYRAYVSVNCTNGQESDIDSVDFTTLNQPITLPYNEDFEGESYLYVPFYTLQSSSINQWHFGSATGAPSAGATSAHSLYISDDNGLTNSYTDSVETDAYATFNVVFPNDPLEYHLAFDYKVKGHHSGYMAFDYLSVYLVDANQEIPAYGPPAGTPLLFEAANLDTWTHLDVILDNVQGTSKQIVFYWYDFGWNNTGMDLNPPAAIDNIVISGSACGQPNNLTASEITTDSATLSWNEVGVATSWTLYYRPQGSIGAYTVVPVTSAPTTTISGLTSNTEYEFYVVANCDGDPSNPSTIATFRTACGTINVLPFTEDFESGLYNTQQYTYVVCWDRFASSSNSFVYVNTNNYYAHSGDNYLDFNYTHNCNNIAILPELGQNINANDLMITFYACHTFNGFYGSLGTLEIGVMTDVTNDSTFVTLDTIDLLSYESYEYSMHIISLVNYTGNGKFIAFRVSNCDNTSYYIDDILLEMRPDCMYPMYFHKEGVTNQSVTLAWTEFGNATSWNIKYDTTGFNVDLGGQTMSVNSTTVTVNGLTNMTSYDFYVQANCGDSQSDWIGPLTVVTGVINMPTNGSETLTTCQSIIFDDGGVDGDYSLNNASQMVIYPATPGEGLEITGTANIHPGYSGWGASYLTFYEGVGTNGTVLGEYTGLNLDIAVASSGPITIFFLSDYFEESGFILNVSCASCTPPNNFAVNNIGTTDATLSWDGGSDAYAIYLSGDTTAYFTTNDTVLHLTGLSVNSHYNVKIRSLCGTDSSMFSPTISFNTNCESITVTDDNPWTESFEGYVGSGEQPFLCWYKAVSDYDYDAPFVYCGYEPACHSGGNSAELKGDFNLLVLPEFTNDIHALRLSFWATSTNPSHGTLEVGVLTDITDPLSFEPIATTGQPAPRGVYPTGNGNFMGPFDFYMAQATTGRIALRYSNYTMSSASWNLDDFTVEIAPSCFAPSNVTIGNISSSEATIAWNGGADEAAWALQYKMSTENDWSADILCNATLYTLQNLQPSTVYQVRVKSVCDSVDESAWSVVEEFATQEEVLIIEPTVVTSPAGDITQHTATLNGAITDPGNQTIIARGFEWKVSGADNYTQVTTGTSNILLFGLSDLNANTEYTYHAFATTTNMTTYGNDVTFTTLPNEFDPCEIPTELHTTEVNIDNITVTWTDNAGASQWELNLRELNDYWHEYYPNSTTFQITGLEGDSYYEVRVKAICEGNESEWSDTILVHTSDVGVIEHLQSSISLYPNPANDVVNVQCTMNNVQVKAVEVFDVYGKLINTVNIVDNPIRVNVAGLAAGMYFVRVNTDEGTVTKSFVKK